MNTTAEVLYQKLKTLPPNELVEIDNFLEFIKHRRHQTRQEASERLAQAMKKLDALDSPPLSTQEIQAEIQSARTEQRLAANAHRS